MHYYKFNIPTWVLSTRHLLPEEEGIYLRLCNWYYDKETPIPEDHRSVLKRLQLLPYVEIVNEILEEYFTLTDEGWIHTKCSELIDEYHKTATKNRKNGAKGGRPKGTKPKEKPAGNQNDSKTKTQKNPVGFQSDANGNPSETLTNNHKPITNNHTSPENIPDGEQQKPSKFKFDARDFALAQNMFKMVKRVNNSAKEPSFEKWADTIRKMREIDKKPIQDIQDLFTWANHDDFWYANILCPEKLRAQWDSLVVKRGQKTGKNPNAKPSWAEVPAIDDDLLPWAKQNGYPGSGQMNFHQYRRKLIESVDNRYKIIRWLDQGQTVEVIAKMLKVSVDAVNRDIKHIRG